MPIFLIYLMFSLSGVLGTLSFMVDTDSDIVNPQPSHYNINTVSNYLANSEYSLDDIVEGVEKKIVWYNEVVKRQFSIVYLHGFSATSQELNPLVSKVAESLKANVFYARLTGHGRGSEAMRLGSVESWIADAEEAIRIGELIGKNIILLSSSTGSTLATWLASKQGDSSIKANIMISPNYGLANKVSKVLRWEWGISLAKVFEGTHIERTPLNDLHEKYWTIKYPLEALKPVVELVEKVLSEDLSVITAPSLIIYSPEDKVISVDMIKNVTKRLKSSLVTLIPYREASDPYQHVLAGDARSPGSTEPVIQIIESFINRLNL